jgi:hypothetical protein
LKHYQTKGIILLTVSALMLLFLWVILLEKEEMSNRIKAHFFVTVLLITPLMRGYDKKDITLDKPFGFEFSPDEDAEQRMQFDTLVAMQAILTRKVVVLDEMTRKIPTEVEKTMADLLTDRRYVNYIESIRDNRDFNDSLARENLLKRPKR